MKEYTVKEFVEGYEKCLNADDKSNYFSENVVVVNEYINFTVKVNLCDLLIDTTCKDKYGNIRFDSATRGMLYDLNLINLYTNIKVEFGNNENPLYDQYDLLQRNYLVYYLLAEIPKKEQDEFRKILNCKLNDFKDNNCTTSICINGLFDRVRDLGVTLINPLIEELDNKLPEILNSLDRRILKK